eukprot:Gb_12702 [translate_table: standard]
MAPLYQVAEHVDRSTSSLKAEDFCACLGTSYVDRVIHGSTKEWYLLPDSFREPHGYQGMIGSQGDDGMPFPHAFYSGDYLHGGSRTSKMGRPYLPAKIEFVFKAAGVVVTIPPSFQPLTSIPPTSSQSLVQETLLFHCGQKSPGVEQVLESPEDIVPSLGLIRVKEKRKGQFNPSMQIVDGALTTRSASRLISSTAQELTCRIEKLEVESILQVDQAQREWMQSNDKISLLISKIAKLDTLSMKDESTTTMEVPVDIKPHFDLLRQKAKVLKEMPLAPPALHTQLATKRMLLDEGYQELAKVIDSSQRQNKETNLRHQYEELISFESRVFMKKETAFQRQARSIQLTQQAKGLIRKVESILDDTLQFIGFEGQEIEELSQQTSALVSLTQEMRQAQAKIANSSRKRIGTKMILYQPSLVAPLSLFGTSTQGPSSSGTGPNEDQASLVLLPSLKVSILDPSREVTTMPRINEEEVGTTLGGQDPKAPTSSSPSNRVVPESSGGEDVLGSSQRTSLLPERTSIVEAPIPTYLYLPINPQSSSFQEEKSFLPGSPFKSMCQEMKGGSSACYN